MEIKKGCENCRNLLDCFHKLNVLMVAKESELQQYKEALRLACENLAETKGCPESNYKCNDNGGENPCNECFTNYFLTKAKGG
jgi:hypothetical protein